MLTSDADLTDIAELNPFRYRGYYYDTESSLYYLNSRYYDPETGRFINADDPALTLISPTATFDKNLYAYCDNNPVVRADDGGRLWQPVVAIAAQYVGDVIGNILGGKKGFDIFKPTSSIGDYVAAGVTALIPGSGIRSIIASNVVSESIASIERHIKNEYNSFGESLGNIIDGTLSDITMGAVTKKVTNVIKSNVPKNYSSYANTQYKSYPNMTKTQIDYNMKKETSFWRGVADAFEFAVDSLINAFE